MEIISLETAYLQSLPRIRWIRAIIGILLNNEDSIKANQQQAKFSSPADTTKSEEAANSFV